MHPVLSRFRKSATLRALEPQLALFSLHDVRDGACSCREGSACTKLGKHPTGFWSRIVPGEKALDDGRSNVAIATGARSGIFVLDEDGPAARAALAVLGPLPLTFTVATPRPGRHYYFNNPDFRVGNSASKVAPGVDVRGSGGFVVAPGSVHKSGGVYVVENAAPIADAPTWLLEALRRESVQTFGVGSRFCKLDFVEPCDLTRELTSFVSELAEACAAECEASGRRHELSKTLAGALVSEGSPFVPLVQLEEVPALVTLVCEEAGFGSLSQKWINGCDTVSMKTTGGAVRGLTSLRQDFATVARVFATSSEDEIADVDAWLAEYDARLRAPVTEAEIEALRRLVASAPKDARTTNLGRVLAVLGLLRERNADGSRNAVCPCGSAARLTPRGRYKCSHCNLTTMAAVLRFLDTPESPNA